MFGSFALAELVCSITLIVAVCSALVLNANVARNHNIIEPAVPPYQLRPRILVWARQCILCALACMHGYYSIVQKLLDQQYFEICVASDLVFVCSIIFAMWIDGVSLLCFDSVWGIMLRNILPFYALICVYATMHLVGSGCGSVAHCMVSTNAVELYLSLVTFAIAIFAVLKDLTEFQSVKATKEFTCGLVSYLSFTYISAELVNPSMKKDALEFEEDVPSLPHCDRTDTLWHRFRSIVAKGRCSNEDDDRVKAMSPSSASAAAVVGIAWGKDSQTKAHLWWNLLLLVMHDWIEMGIFQFLNSISTYLAPLALQRVLLYIGEASSSSGGEAAEDSVGADGVETEGTAQRPLLPMSVEVAVALLFLGPFVQSIVFGQYLIRGRHLGVRVRAVLIAAVYAKALSVDMSASAESVGKLNNLISVDVGEIQEFVAYCHTLWAAPLELLCACLMLYFILGNAAFGGILIMVLAIAFGLYLTKWLKKYQSEMLHDKDRRMGVIDEVLNSIRVIKFYAWEQRFTEKIHTARVQELNSLRKRCLTDAVLSVTWDIVPAVVAATAFIMHSYILGLPLSPSIGFTSLTLFNLLRHPLDMFPDMINRFIRTMLSLKRIETFLDTPDVAGLALLTSSSDGHAADADSRGKRDKGRSSGSGAPIMSPAAKIAARLAQIQRAHHENSSGSKSIKAAPAASLTPISKPDPSIAPVQKCIVVRDFTLGWVHVAKEEESPVGQANTKALHDDDEEEKGEYECGLPVVPALRSWCCCGGRPSATGPRYSRSRRRADGASRLWTCCMKQSCLYRWDKASGGTSLQGDSESLKYRLIDSSQEEEGGEDGDDRNDELEEPSTDGAEEQVEIIFGDVGDIGQKKRSSTRGTSRETLFGKLLGVGAQGRAMRPFSQQGRRGRATRTLQMLPLDHHHHRHRHHQHKQHHNESKGGNEAISCNADSSAPGTGTQFVAKAPGFDREDPGILSERFDGVVVFDRLSLEVPAGALAVVVGVTGSGKSSLLQGVLLGEGVRLGGSAAMYSHSSQKPYESSSSGWENKATMVGGAGDNYSTPTTLTCPEGVSYAPQTAWIQNATLRDNVLFGNPFDQERYERVLHACALKADLQLLPAGDLTEIGEKGVNLSGGQQQRVSLARAAYAHSDIVLLDDPLSAVDAVVGEHIFRELIMGFLAGRTRLLVTHNMPLAVPSADLVICIEKQHQHRHHHRHHQHQSHLMGQQQQQHPHSHQTSRSRVIACCPPRELRSVLQECRRQDESQRHGPGQGQGQLQPSRVLPPPCTLGPSDRVQTSIESQTSFAVRTPAHVGGPSKPADKESLSVVKAAVVDCVSDEKKEKAAAKGGGGGEEEEEADFSIFLENLIGAVDQTIGRSNSSSRGKNDRVDSALHTETSDTTKAIIYEATEPPDGSFLGNCSYKSLAQSTAFQAQQEQAVRNAHGRGHGHMMNANGALSAAPVEARLKATTITATTASSGGDRTKDNAVSKVDQLCDGLRSAPTVGKGSPTVGKGGIIDEETKSVGTISWASYWFYIRAGGGWLALIALFLACTSMAVAWFFHNLSLGNWLAAMESDALANDGKSERGVYSNSSRAFAVYCISVGLIVVASTFRVTSKLVTQLLASSRIHEALILSAVHAPCSWFDATPIGRIINRFSQDVGTVDSRIIYDLYGLVGCSLDTLQIVVVIAISLPALLLPLLPVLLFTWWVAKQYLHVSRELKRLESIKNSPVFVLFSETLLGLPVVRAFRAEQRFFRTCCRRVDEMNQCHLYLWIMNRWLAFRMQVLGAVVSGAVGWAVVYYAHSIGSTMAGIVLIYSMGFCDALTWLARQHASCQMDMNSVERIQEYSDTPSENYSARKGNGPLPSPPPPQAIVTGDSWNSDAGYHSIKSAGERAGDTNFSENIPESFGNPATVVSPIRKVLNQFGSLLFGGHAVRDGGVSISGSAELHYYQELPTVVSESDSCHDDELVLLPGWLPPLRSPAYAIKDLEHGSHEQQISPAVGKWPTVGEVTFDNLSLKYGPNSSPVLRGVSFHIPGRSKVGVVGRTGAGKSSLIAALFRMVEPCGGRIEIDGVNTLELPLAQLRSNIAIVPQEPTLFRGSVRFNLDPFEQHSEEELWKALRSAHLAEHVAQMPAHIPTLQAQAQATAHAHAQMERDGSNRNNNNNKDDDHLDGDGWTVQSLGNGDNQSRSPGSYQAPSSGPPAATAAAMRGDAPLTALYGGRGRLCDKQVAERGANFSVGQRQLLCMARAILRRAPVLVLDECTASVDHETDALIQETVREQLNSCTVICIAHRLHTVAYYDRVLVMDRGQVAEYDSPLALLQRERGPLQDGRGAMTSVYNGDGESDDNSFGRDFQHQQQQQQGQQPQQQGSIFREMCEASGDFEELLALAQQAHAQKQQ